MTIAKKFVFVRGLLYPLSWTDMDIFLHFKNFQKHMYTVFQKQSFYFWS